MKAIVEHIGRNKQETNAIDPAQKFIVIPGFSSSDNSFGIKVEKVKIRNKKSSNNTEMNERSRRFNLFPQSDDTRMT